MNEVTIILIDKEVILFKQFREYQDRFQFLVQNGVFGLKRGSATINFDNAGNISSIQKTEYIYPQIKKT